MLPSLTCIASLTIAVRRHACEHVTPSDLFAAHVIRAAWRDARLNQLEDDERAELRAAFGRRTLREFLGGPA